MNGISSFAGLRPGLLGLALLFGATAGGPLAAQANPVAFDGYWNRGEAEVSRFKLTQDRYGEPRQGHAIMVFVTEDFRTDTLVKDESDRKPSASTRVLKLNRIQRFSTGIYDYSLMQSVFAPVDRERDPRAFKATASVQDWCGHVWLQLGLAGTDAYQLTGHSYFENEGEEERTIDARGALLEDELFTLARTDPERLPVGKTKLVPSSFDARLRHYRLAALDAEAELSEPSAEGMRTYTVTYPRMQRSLSIDFEADFPHRIAAFRETSRGRTTLSAERSHLVKSAYWGQSSERDNPLRKTLGLEPGDLGRAKGSD